MKRRDQALIRPIMKMWVDDRQKKEEINVDLGRVAATDGVNEDPGVVSRLKETMNFHPEEFSYFSLLMHAIFL